MFDVGWDFMRGSGQEKAVYIEKETIVIKKTGWNDHSKYHLNVWSIRYKLDNIQSYDSNDA
jgi:hypothetical protein